MTPASRMHISPAINAAAMISMLEPSSCSANCAARTPRPAPATGALDAACITAFPWLAVVVMTASGDIGRVLGQQRPGFLVEAVARLRVEAAGAQHLTERRSVDRVEAQAFAFERLLQVDVGACQVFALLA